MTRKGPEERRRLRDERSRRGVAAAASLGSENELRVEESTVLNDLFSLMLHLKPTPVVARVATRDGGLVWIDFEDVCLGPTEWDLATMMDPEGVTAHHQPDPKVLARCTELRTLQVALCLAVFNEDFGDLEGWEGGIRSMLGMLAS